MLSPKDFYELLNNDLDLKSFFGVPDSTLKDFCSYIDDHSSKHMICANEGSAISQAMGYYLATGKTPVVYMQNSGFGNCLNPILSMASERIYQIPMLIFVGWRGHPDQKDEPQHLHQGEVMTSSLKAMGLDFIIAPDSLEDMKKVLTHKVKELKEKNSPLFVLIKKDSFHKYTSSKPSIKKGISREKVIKFLTNKFNNAKFFASTGFIGRELYQIREQNHQEHKSDFLCIGAMGHVSQIAYSFAKNSGKKTICLDGDGSFLMHMGGITSIKNFGEIPLIHIVFNNGCHLSVGGQPTVAHDIDLALVAKSCGFKHSVTIRSFEQLENELELIKDNPGPIFFNILVSNDYDKNLMRPTKTPVELKKLFMDKS